MLKQSSLLERSSITFEGAQEADQAMSDQAINGILKVHRLKLIYNDAAEACSCRCVRDCSCDCDRKGF